MKNLKSKDVKGVPVFVDNDPSLFFEKHAVLNNIFHTFILLPILSFLPKKIGRGFVVKSSKAASDVYKHAKTSRALEALYNFKGKIDTKNNIIDGMFTFIWQHNFRNAKAVRNRFKLAKRELKDAIREVHSIKQSEINLLSLASGSARVVLEIMSELQKEGIAVKAKLLDLDPEALKLSMKIAKELGVDKHIILCNDKVSNFEKFCENWNPDVVEMIGFMDYLSQEKAIDLSTKIFNQLKIGGHYITCNIRDNSERKILERIFNWRMIYRNEDELADVALSGGFNHENVKIIYEPYLIHGLAVSKK